MTVTSETMDANAQVYRTEASLKQALSDLTGLKARYTRVTVQDKGRRYNTDLLEAIELGFLLELAEVTVLEQPGRRPEGCQQREDVDDQRLDRHDRRPGHQEEQREH